ncbi:hypothetical protein [Rufibacter tibetensis]|uniref:Uncharacterized protein n=1 Tax=Rufibacter tibetensis TaxID=512763 RepID=A0A0P0CBU7_9BACT|nr:hypothetical protein [Rufibacter tibetensis]ALI99157.1 hypothetical protein DC20_09435 [Rufibacter tibetensis]
MEKNISEPLVAIPENFNIKEFTAKHSTKDIKPFKEDILLYFMGLITSVPSQDFDLITESGYVRLSSKLMQGIAHNYLQYIDYLKEHGVIDRIEQYQKAGMHTMREGKMVTLEGKCMGYRFMPKYQTRVKYLPLTDARFTKRLSQKADFKTDGKDIYPFLHRWMKDKRLNIDIEGAEKFFMEYLGIEGNAYPEPNARMRFNAYMHPLRMLKEGNGNFTFTIDETGRRLHTPFTFMKREAKQFITWGKDKRKLVSLDIKNSQPYLLLGLLSGNLYGLDKEFKEALNNLRETRAERLSLADQKLNLKSFNSSAQGFLDRISMDNSTSSIKRASSKLASMSFTTPFTLKCLHNDYLSIIEHIFLRSSSLMSTNISSSIMLVDMFSNSIKNIDSSAPEDILRYRQGVTDGSFYPNLKKSFESDLGMTYNSMRDFKDDILAVFYSKINGGAYIKERKKLFAKHYPTIIGFLDLLKGKNFLGKESYTLPVILLQRLEAHMMLDRIGKRIAFWNPNCPMFFIHDNLVVLEGYEAEAERIIKEEMERCIGIAPMVTVEPWTGKPA